MTSSIALSMQRLSTSCTNVGSDGRGIFTYLPVCSNASDMSSDAANTIRAAGTSLATLWAKGHVPCVINTFISMTLLLINYNVPVFHVNDPICNSGQFLIMRNHYKGLTGPVPQVHKQPVQGGRIFRIQVT